MFRRLKRDELLKNYFDYKKDREIFERACRKCYFPSNTTLLQLIDESKKEKKQVKVAFSLSGVFLEQCERFKPDLLESFKQLAETRCVEFLDQTYYHSLVGLYPIRDEFIEQVKMHRQIMRDLLNVEPTFFENTELLYNNVIAETVEELGYLGILTEGVERVLNGRSPNYVYRAKNAKNLKVLLRNFKLTDDIGFRFSQRTWNEWPLTADKYANWLATTPGHCIVIFPDYETFGEHHWPETGIHDFLKHMPKEILKQEHLSMATPSEVVQKNKVVGEVDVPEIGGTVSWADIARDTSCWLGNAMQWAYYLATRELEPFVKESGDATFLKIWRYLLISDHLYYMSTAGGASGEVHSYFSPYSSTQDATIAMQSAMFDFESRVKLYVIAANEPFRFSTAVGEKNFTEVTVWSLKGFSEAVKTIHIQSIEFHNQKGDFEMWASLSLRDTILAGRFKAIRLTKISGRKLRNKIRQVARKRFQELNEGVRASTQWF